MGTAGPVGRCPPARGSITLGFACERRDRAVGQPAFPVQRPPAARTDWFRRGHQSPRTTGVGIRCRRHEFGSFCSRLHRARDTSPFYPVNYRVKSRVFSQLPRLHAASGPIQGNPGANSRGAWLGTVRRLGQDASATARKRGRAASRRNLPVPRLSSWRRGQTPGPRSEPSRKRFTSDQDVNGIIPAVPACQYRGRPSSASRDAAARNSRGWTTSAPSDSLGCQYGRAPFSPVPAARRESDRCRA